VTHANTRPERHRGDHTKANQLADKSNIALLQLEKMGMRFDPQAPLDLRAVIKELPDLIAAFKG
jgi:hypothetical protein